MFPFAGSGERPFWLLPQPLALLLREHRPFYGSPLKLLRGAGTDRMRLVGGQVATVRDYFVAEDAAAACYWIYRERAGDRERSWFLHGLFA